MDLQELFKNDNAIKVGMWLARLTPRWAGYWLARYVGNKMVEDKPPVYHRLRENISHIPGTNDQPGKLDEITRRSLINMGKCYYDFYHVIGKTPEEVVKHVNIPARLFEEVDRIQAEGRGVLIAGMHMSNFDLGSICLSANGLVIQGLSAANPNQGYQFQNELRKKYGFRTTPIDPKTLREAIRNLKNGGIVATGLDWPQPDETELTEVFGKPAYIPLGTARLAMMANAVTIIVAFYKDPRPGYQMHMSEPMDVIRSGNKSEDIRLNTRQYMKFLEKILSQHPDQWMMFHSIWAEPQSDPD